jgi:hypothetical protein
MGKVVAVNWTDQNSEPMVPGESGAKNKVPVSGGLCSQSLASMMCCRVRVLLVLGKDVVLLKLCGGSSR